MVLQRGAYSSILFRMTTQTKRRRGRPALLDGPRGNRLCVDFPTAVEKARVIDEARALDVTATDFIRRIVFGLDKAKRAELVGRAS